MRRSTSIISESFFRELKQVNTDRASERRSIQIDESFLSDLEKAVEVIGNAEREAINDLPMLKEVLEKMRKYWQAEFRRKGGWQDADPNHPIFLPFGLFGTIEFGLKETAYTRALAWLLGDNEHGFRYSLLEAVLRTVDTSVATIDSANVAAEHHIEGGRIDIFCNDCNYVDVNTVEHTCRLIIEAKVDASESDKQLSNYEDYFDLAYNDVQNYFVFITPNGRRPETNKTVRWHSMSFDDLFRILWKAGKSNTDAAGFNYLRYYLAGILSDVLDQRLGNKASVYTVSRYLAQIGEVDG